MRCDQCDCPTVWKGDKDDLEVSFDKKNWMFVRVYECEKCGCETHVFYPNFVTSKGIYRDI